MTLAPLLLALAVPTSLPAPSLPAPPRGELEHEVAALGVDVEGLWRLARSYTESGAEEEACEVARRILELDAEHEGAHGTLRHHRYDGHWFETYTALSRYRREESRRMWEQHGVVRFEDGWAAPEDVPFLRMKWVQDGAGRWRSPRALAEEREAADLAEAGWQQQDLEWVHPDDFEKWREGLWKCGDEWLPLEAANAWHADLARPWRIPGEHFVVEATLDRESARWAAWWADRTHDDLVRLFGLEPAARPTLLVLNGVAQYNARAAGDPASGLRATEASGASSVHYAYFADAWYDTSVTPAEFHGLGVCYWDPSDPSLAPYGQHAVRHAAAHSFLEAVDPSWDTVSRVATGEVTGVALPAFWGEKRIAPWMRYGAASYCERFFLDEDAAEGTDPWWARTWALQNLQGGVHDVEAVFAFQLDPSDPASSSRLIHEAGALVSFAVDGGCRPVERAWAAFREALAEPGAEVDDERAALQAAILDNADELREYLGG